MMNLITDLATNLIIHWLLNTNFCTFVDSSGLFIFEEENQAEK